MIIVFITNRSINRIIYNIYYLSCNNIIRNHFTYIIRKVLILNLVANGHLYVVGQDFWKKSCQTRRKVGATSDLSDR